MKLQIGNAIKTARFPADHFLARSRAELREKLQREIHGFSIVSAEQADGPVGADHQTVFAESGPDGLKTKTKVVWLPSTPRCFRNETRNFTKDIFAERKFPDVARPVSKLARRNRRFGHVIQNKRLIWKSPRQLRGKRDVPRKN